MRPAQFTSTGYNPPTLPPSRKAPAMPETEKIDATFHDGDGDRLVVRTEDESLGAYVVTRGPGVYVKPADAPAVALAILEAAGHTATADGSTSYMTARAVRNLRESARIKAAREAREAEKAAQAEAEAKAQAEREAADAEALDREALALFNASRAHVGDYPLADLPNKEMWRSIARAARALAAPAPAPFPVVMGVRNGTREYGVLDRANDRVAPFGALSNARTGRDRVAENQVGWSWHPAADYTALTEVDA